MPARNTRASVVAYVCAHLHTPEHTPLCVCYAGVPSLVLERDTKVTTHPKAHYINNRTMEVCAWPHMELEALGGVWGGG